MNIGDDAPPAKTTVSFLEEQLTATGETSYLLQSSANAERLLSSIARLNAGKGEDHAVEVAKPVSLSNAASTEWREDAK